MKLYGELSLVWLVVQIYPALLGVRLLNDLRRGTLPFTHHDRLEWAVVPPQSHIKQALGILLSHSKLLHGSYRVARLDKAD